jgi:hypothetical protein
LDDAKIAGSSQSAAYIAAFAAVAVCILVTMILVLVLLALLPSGRSTSGQKLRIGGRGSISHVQAPQR